MHGAASRGSDDVADATSDPFGMWRTLMQQWETQANAALTEVTGKEEFSREMNRMMAVTLKLQGAFNEGVEKALTTFNMPSKDDVARLSDRLGVIEAKLDTLLAAQATPTPAPSPATRAKRTRRPPGEAPTQ